jgi:hypothetical protein
MGVDVGIGVKVDIGVTEGAGDGEPLGTGNGLGESSAFGDANALGALAESLHAISARMVSVEIMRFMKSQFPMGSDLNATKQAISERYERKSGDQWVLTSNHSLVTKEHDRGETGNH